ncbi:MULTISPECIES: ABC transporter ATP-binding protein [Paenibacillus]|uniref:ABC transporter ATP-binding protein n=1 Tax=Paenibacillus TaxID=44249 RepID=UPI0022B8BF77|nr:ABC transporter ATP-binding protein [Paenibacillus caseinilyticus]MCZ8520271.1 ABC transporter ATP-binding protein [Paenibacillus caseinilyticus]
MHMVELTDIVKRYGSKLTVDHLNLTIRRGEIFGLLGPNGAGKSTTIRMICGLLAPDHGEIRVEGLRVDRQPLEVKRRIGLVPQELAFYEGMTARENVSFFGRLYGLRGSLLKERAAEALEFAGLTERQWDRPETYSGGMKRRLNIACALMHHPGLVIMDEPTVGIDPQSRLHILDSVRELNRRGTTIIYTSHYMEEVAAVSTRVGILDRGHLIACGTQEELRAQAGTEEKLQVAAAGLTDGAVEELRMHPGIRQAAASEGGLELSLRPGEGMLQDVLYILSKHGIAIQSLNRVEPGLETLFLALTGRKERE